MTNTDPTGLPHTFTAGTVEGFAQNPSGVFDSGFMEAGDSFAWTPQTDVDQPYYCMLHTWMVGEIIIGDVDVVEPIPELTDEEFNVTTAEKVSVGDLLKIDIIASHKTSIQIEILTTTGNSIHELTCNKTTEFICETYWSVPNNMIQGTYNIKAYDGIGNIGESNFYYESGVGAITTNIILQNTVELEYIPESESPKSDLNTVPISEEIFERKKTDTISSILFAPGFSYHFSLERDFTSELGLTESYYQLYKIIDDKTTKRIGDLRFYLGSSEWWDHNASLQENDTSGFNNIFKVKFFIMHKGDSVVAQQISNNLSSALRVLVPEWSNEIGSTSNTWLIDSLNYSERNDQSKRENSIMTQEKEIKILHDDLDWGTITLIVTENADTIKIPSVSTDGMKILNQLLDEPTPTPEPIVEVASTSNCGTGTELVNGICQVVQTEEKTAKGGGCLIATATYGSEMAPQVQQLRELRDNQLLQTESGTAFMGMFNDIYYSFSPIIADYERENQLFKEAVKLAITPMISTLSLMENAESESEVLSLGISIIVLNIGMYLAVPAIVVIGIRKKF
jgi:hypothetical protein